MIEHVDIVDNKVVEHATDRETAPSQVQRLRTNAKPYSSHLPEATAQTRTTGKNSNALLHIVLQQFVNHEDELKIIDDKPKKRRRAL